MPMTNGKRGCPWETTRTGSHAICESRLREFTLSDKPSVFAMFVAESCLEEAQQQGASSLCFRLARRSLLSFVFLFVFLIACVIVISIHYLRKDLLQVFQTHLLKPGLWIGHFLASIPKLTAMVAYGETL